MDVRLPRFMQLPLKYHLVAGLFIRMLLIAYGDYHDDHYDVPYTDVDYKVFTDAARHVVRGDSPYRRHTYRYSPVIAYMLTPNIFFHRNFGKILFSIFDILVTVAVKKLVEQQLSLTWKDKNEVSNVALYCSFFWIYNPMSIGISTRGNADSVTCFFVILSLMFLQTNIVLGHWKYVWSGILLGISIHLRLYPLAFSYPMYLSLGAYKITRRTRLAEGFLSLLPNVKQMLLSMSCILTLIFLTYGMYAIYGYEFLFETYIYHLFRKDTRHNFSVLFYYSYLIMDNPIVDVVKLITHICEFSLLFALSLTFGRQPQTLPFALFSQAVVLVAFNSVMTSQYFIWFISLLPLVIHSFAMERRKGLLLCVVWAMAQTAWLTFAYLLEFKCREVFIFIWLKSVVLFCGHIFVLSKMIRAYEPFHGFGLLKKKN